MDHQVLVAPGATQVYDLTNATEASLLDIDMPLDFTVSAHAPSPVP